MPSKGSNNAQVSNLFLNVVILFARLSVWAFQTPLNSYSNIYNVFILTVFTSEQIVWPYLQMCYEGSQWQMIFHRKSQHASEVEARLLSCAVCQSALISPKHKPVAQPPWVGMQDTPPLTSSARTPTSEVSLSHMRWGHLACKAWVADVTQSLKSHN